MSIKIFIFFLINCFSFFSIAEDYNLFIENAIQKSPSHKIALLQYESNRIARLPQKYRFVPYPTFESSYVGNVFALDASPNQFHALKTGIAFSEELPGGVVLRGEASQYFGFAKNITETNQYEFSSSLSASIPLYFISPSAIPFATKGQLYDAKLQEEIFDLEFTNYKKSVKASFVSLIGSYLLLKERIELLEKRIELQKGESVSDEKLWKQGYISTFDLTEKNTKRNESYISLMQLNQQLMNIEQELNLQEIDKSELTKNLSEWISYWKNFLQENKIQNGLVDCILEKENELNFYNTSRSLFNSTPRLNFSVVANPLSSSVGGESFSSSIKNWWENITSAEWQFSLSFTLPVVPYSSEYHLNALQKLNLKKNEIQETQLNKIRMARKENYDSNISIIQRMKEKAILDSLDEGNKMISAQSSFDIGYLNELNFDYQKLNVLIQENYVQELELRYIVTVLQGY